MAKSFLIAATLLLALLLGWVLWFWNPAPHMASPTASFAVPQGGDFTLRSAQGPLSLHDLRGKVVLLYFGYTMCPDVCPTSLAATARALDLLDGKELARTRVLFVTVDPERDTLEKLGRYTPFFHPGIVGLTGTPQDIARVAKLYGAAYARHDIGSAGGYAVDHSAFTYVIAPDGKLAATLPHGMAPPDVVRAIRAAMNGGQPASQPETARSNT